MNATRNAVSSFINGDKSAFDDIYYAAHRKVSIIANTYLKNHTDAEEAIQDVFMQAYKRINTIKDADKAMSWILTLTRNTCLNRLEKSKKIEVAFDNDLEKRKSAFDKVHDEREYHSPEQNLLKKENNSFIIEIISMLPYEQKDAIILYYFKNISVAEVAKRTKTTIGTVKSRLYYGRKKLRKLATEREQKKQSHFEVAICTK